MTTTPQEPEQPETLDALKGGSDEDELPQERGGTGGPDVGGPASGIESTTETGMESPSDVGDDETDSQARNPL
jgi:hypothetical protein